MNHRSVIALANRNSIGIPNLVNVASVAERGVLCQLASAKGNRDIFGRLVADRLKSASFV
jgi:hypothetical protein